jgi:sec-independent protein translocase protein TatC
VPAKPNIPPTPESDGESAHIDAQAPLVEHLVELRRRLIICTAAFVAASLACYAVTPQLYAFLVRPLAESLPDPTHRRLIYTGLTEAFFTYMKLAAVAGFFLSFPVIAAQVYAFMAPGLYKHERRVLLPYLVAAPTLFLLGAAMAYYGVFPVAWKFFVSFQSVGGEGGLPIELEARVGEYLSLVLHLLMAFGISFQLPIVLTLLCRAELLTAGRLARSRRYAVVIIACAAAFLAPPDVFSMVALMLPLYGLYEVSILACHRVEKKRKIA